MASAENGREMLGSADIDILNDDRVVFDTIGLDEGDVVVVDGESKGRTASRSEDTELVTFATLNIDQNCGQNRSESIYLAEWGSYQEVCHYSDPCR